MTTCRELRAEEMTQKEACRLALEFAQRHQLTVSEITAVRRIRFHRPTQGPRDLWVVCFASEVPSDIAGWAREIIVEVRNDTGEVTRFDSSSD